MQPKVSYPLNQVLDVKKKRVEDQEKVVKDKQQALEREKEKLAQREADRDKAVQHDKDKLTQLRKLLDEGTTCPKILQMKAYLKVTKERVKIEEKKVKEQQTAVENANKALEMAKQELKIKRQDVDKIETHKKDWLKELKKEMELIEEREYDEIGSIIFSANQRRNKNS
jgi:flagellar biosynthesis chaperone FliJ